MKKRFLAAVALLLVAMFVVSACESPAAQPTGEIREDALFPETFHFRVVQAGRALYDDDNMVEMAINDMLNVQVDYMRIPEATYEEQLGILLASRDLPDIVYFGSFAGAAGAFNSWVQQGAIIPLDGLLETHGQDITGRWRDDDWARVRSDIDGRIYGIPAISDLSQAFSLMLRADWLEALGLDVPVTLDEWVAVLEAVRHGDPRGDGVQVVPYSGLLRPWMNAFGIQSTDWQVVDGKYIAFYEHPNYIEYVTFMRDLYARGLIDPEYFTTNLVVPEQEAISFADIAFATQQ